jgi:Retrotransposon gag protein
MSTAAKLVGMPPEQFNGTAAKAESFLNALQNYYYLNEALFTNKSRCVAAALSHFIVGTPAGEWACDKQNMALTGTHITYGTWQTFLNDFKKHFVSVQTEQQAMNAIWTVHMKNRPFHEWYQEWSTYAARSGANDATKMYAFRQALPRGLNDKLLGVTPIPTTLTGLVDKARAFSACKSKFFVGKTRRKTLTLV